MSDQISTLTAREQYAVDNGLAYMHLHTDGKWRVIPIVRGGEETPEEKAEREAAEAAAANQFTPITSQEDFDRRIQDRIARVKATPPDDYEDLKAAKAKLEEIEAANQSELEKAQKRAEKAEQDAADAATRLKEGNLRSAIIAEAAKPDRKVVDPEAVLAMLDKSSLTLDGDGKPTNIAEAMDALLADKTYLVGNGGTTTRHEGADQGARGGGGTGVEQLTSTDGMTSEQIATAVSEGRLADYLSTPK